MASDLISPGVSVSVIDDSYFIPGQATTVPLFFIATKSGKTQPNGITPAAGTLEHGVVRTVTSRKQALELYGIPDFRSDISGNEYHGDARNEYGLLALHQFLGVGNRAYVVRANVDLNDEPITFMSLGVPAYQPGSEIFNGIGNGTISSITVASSQIRPQTFTVSFTSPTAFSVSGSLSGQLTPGVVGVPYTSPVISFTVSAGAVPFAAGDSFVFQVVYVMTPSGGNVGNGGAISLTADTMAIDEDYTITFTSPSAYDVAGSVSGPTGTGVVGSPFDDGRINFTMVAGTTPFVAGDQFTVSINPVVISSPLGVNDADRRGRIIESLIEAVSSNMDIRSPLYEFNLIACPGYWEADIVSQLQALSEDVKSEALVIADTPSYYTPDQVAQWALSTKTVDNRIAYYYPWCLTSNIDGRTVLAAPSGTALRTIAYSDSVSYVWFAPAGVQRGVVTGVSRVGYFTGTPGTATTFVDVNLNEGQRDILYEYDKNINPITFFPGRGILVWGQKTAAPAASALDRVNVQRLVMYLKRALRKGMLPYVFEPNDQITRDNVKAAADGVLNDILVKRGLTDYATYCDASNNDAATIDRNELVLDVAIKPTKAAEFVYVNIRVANTGDEI